MAKGPSSRAAFLGGGFALASVIKKGRDHRSRVVFGSVRCCAFIQRSHWFLSALGGRCRERW